MPAQLLDPDSERTLELPPPGSGSCQTLGTPWSRQCQTYWCWAACTKMVLDHFGDPHEQCEIAGWFPEVSDCCANPGPCNVPRPMGAVGDLLTSRGIRYEYSATGLGFDEIRAHIAAGHPIEFAYPLRGAIGHLAVIVGCQGSDFVVIRDPYEEHAVVRYGYLTVPSSWGRWYGTWACLGGP